MVVNLVTRDRIRAQFVGKTLHEVPTPAIVLDLAKVEVNCERMIEAAGRLGLSWRAHIKTHKTAELTRLQVGDKDSTPVNIIVSTIAEAENVVPLLQEYQARGRQVNVLYSFPLYASSIDRLAAISAALGPGGLTVMVDHAEQIPLLAPLAAKSASSSSAAGAGDNRPLVFLKVNMGSNRAGVIPGSDACAAVIRDLLAAEAAGSCIFWGLYTHAGHSYAERDDWAAMRVLGDEWASIRGVAVAVREADAAAAAVSGQQKQQQHPLVLSVGATPTVTTLAHPDFAIEGGEGEGETTGLIKDLIARMRADGLTPEVHAGVYPTLDVQQLAAHACDAAVLNPSAIAVSVLADVASVYPERGGDGGSGTEVMVNVGCIALGREPCIDMGKVPGQHYGGWGIVMPWAGVDNVVPGPEFPAVHGGWQVARISQEHGVLAWRGGGPETSLAVGQRVRIWPNHSCITGAAYPWYLVVDSRNKGREDEIVDVWLRWNGW